MKRMWIAFGLIISIIFICVFEMNTVKNLTNNFQNKIESVEYSVENEEIESAIEKIEDVNSSFSKNYKFFAVFVPHEKVDEIGLSITSAKTSLECDEKAQFLLESRRARQNLKNLCETESIKMQNIL